MKKFAIVLAVLYFVALSGSIVYSPFTTDIIGSVNSENIEKLKSQLEKNKDKELVHRALLFAIDYQKIDAIKVLVDNVEDIDYEQTSGRMGTVFDAALATDNIDIINMLIDKGVNINRVGNNSKMTPVQRVIEHGHYSLACELIDKGADLSLGNFIFNGHSGSWNKEEKEDAERILKIAIENSDADKIGSIESFFRMAVNLENFELMDILINKYPGADYLKLALKTAMIGNKSEMVDYITRKGGKITYEEMYDMAVALFHDGNFEMIKQIAIKNGSIDNEEAVPMFTRALLTRQTDAVKFLLENGLDVKALPVKGDHVPIIIAIRYCDPDIVKLLLEYNVPVDVEAGNGKDAFEILKVVREEKVEWFDFEHKRNLDNIYNLLKAYSDKNNENLL